MELNLNNKTALITGASKGIGKAIAESMANEGCNLILTARSSDKLNELKVNLQKKHNISIEVIAIDLSKKNVSNSLIILDYDDEVENLDKVKSISKKISNSRKKYPLFFQWQDKNLIQIKSGLVLWI